MSGVYSDTSYFWEIENVTSEQWLGLRSLQND